MTTPTKHVYSQISAAMAAIGALGIAKDRRNKDQGYSFRGIDDVYNAMSPILTESGLVVMPQYANRVVSERATKSGGAMWNVSVEGSFTVVSVKDGSSVTVGPFFGEAQDSADKATNKAMSAAMKYFLFQTFVVPTEGDNDADAHTPEAGPKKPAKEIEHITAEQVATIANLLAEGAIKVDLFCQHFKISKIEEIPADKYADFEAYLKKQVEKRKAKSAKPAEPANDPEAQAASGFEG